MGADVYRPWRNGLGDRWASINLLLRRAESTNEIVLVEDAGRRGLHEEILGVLDGPTSLIELVDAKGNVKVTSADVWITDYYPTIRRWRWPGHSVKVAVHFDGVSSATDKNPSAADKESITNHLLDLGYELIFLGPQLSISHVVDILATSAFFVGVDSGFSHVAHSVGVPMFLLQYKMPLVACHRGKSYMLCNGAADLINNRLKTWLNYRKFLGF